MPKNPKWGDSKGKKLNQPKLHKHMFYGDFYPIEILHPIDAKHKDKRTKSAHRQSVKWDKPKGKKYHFKFTGYIIGRKMYDYDGKLKAFSYYPREEHGKPPYWYKNKSEAIKSFKKMKEKNQFPASESNAVVTKFTKKTYLDRY